jgi:phosphate transport system permease protein
VTNTQTPAAGDPGARTANPSGPPLAPEQGARRSRNQRIGATLLFQGTRIGAVIPMLVLLALLIILIIEAIPAIRYNGWGFFTGSVWEGGNPYGTPTHAGGVYHLPGAKFGAWPLIAGTLESSAIALIVGFPIAVGAAVILVEKLPPRLAAVIGLLLEVLAGIPSAVIGIWGIFTFGPFLAKHIYPILVHMPNVPILNIFRGVPSTDGAGLLTGGLVLAAMILPIIASTTRDLLLQVPNTTKEAAEALGMTSSEAFFTVQARWIRSGVIGAAVLGLGRALGETIAIALVSGGFQQLATDIYSPMTTIAATIVLQLSSAQGDPTGLAVKVLAEAALVLLGITFLVNVLARLIIRRSAKGTSLPVGAGL